MTCVFVQIRCNPGKTYAVADAIYEREIASELYSTSGDYDLLMKLYILSEEDVGKFICDKNPLQMKLSFALWNRKSIKQVIGNLWSIRLALRTISDYMKRWEFTPQKPAKMAYERNSKAVQNG